ELKMCLHELSIVDDTLEALGVPKEYQQLRNWIIRIIIGWIVYIFFDIAPSFYHSFLMYNLPINFVTLYRLFMRFHAQFIIVLSALIWGSILRHVHLQLCLISRKLNKIFNIQMLSLMLWSFFHTVVSYANIYLILADENKQIEIWTFKLIYTILYKILLFILHSAFFLTLNYICQTIYLTILDELSNYNLDEVNLREQILQFMLQIKLKEVKFSIGFFHFGYNFVHAELKMCLHELSVIDDTLEALGAPKEYLRLRKWIIRIIIGWIAYIFCRVALGVYSMFLWFYIPINFVNIYQTFLIFYPEFVIILSSLIWATILRYTSSRFHQVNDRLQVLYSDLFENNADRRQNKCILVCQRMMGVKDCKQYIWIIMHVHLQLCLISRKLNKIFNVQMLLLMLWNFCLTLYFYMDIYTMLAKENKQIQIWTFKLFFNYLYSFSLFILISTFFLILNYICQIIYRKVNETVAILYKLSNCNLNKDLHEQVNNYDVTRNLTILCVILLAFMEV
ncbi:hypothetical protein ALC53_05849, partial [Atta colombica]